MPKYVQVAKGDEIAVPALPESNGINSWLGGLLRGTDSSFPGTDRLRPKPRDGWMIQNRRGVASLNKSGGADCGPWNRSLARGRGA
jgi:hypothetical protein